MFVGGNYCKHYNNPDQSDIILSFDANAKEHDNHYIAKKILNKRGFQSVDNRENYITFEFEYNTDNDRIGKIKKYFNDLLFSFYCINGERIHNLIVHFDFDNNFIEVNGHRRRIEDNDTYIYKVLKTKIKAKNGIYGLYKHVLASMHVESPFNCATYNVLAKIGEIDR